jgi:hypothetical protein
MSTQRNKIHSICTLDRVARDLREDADWLSQISLGMEPEDGLIWVYGLGGETMAFSDDGIENLRNLIEIHRETCPPKKT